METPHKSWPRELRDALGYALDQGEPEEDELPPGDTVELLRFRWEPQLRLVAPRAWETIERELAPLLDERRRAQADYSELWNTHRECETTERNLRTSLTKAEELLRAGQTRVLTLEAKLSELDARLKTSVPASGNDDAKVLADVVVHLGNMLAKTEPRAGATGWRDVVSERAAKSVMPYLDASPPEPEAGHADE